VFDITNNRCFAGNRQILKKRKIGCGKSDTRCA
jgi:hypothetical protein